MGVYVPTKADCVYCACNNAYSSLIWTLNTKLSGLSFIEIIRKRKGNKSIEFLKNTGHATSILHSFLIFIHNSVLSTSSVLNVQIIPSLYRYFFLSLFSHAVCHTHSRGFPRLYCTIELTWLYLKYQLFSYMFIPLSKYIYPKFPLLNSSEL